jgi:ribonuclease III
VSNVGSNANLAATARKFGLESCVITNPGHIGPVSSGMLSTTVEAILGAIYLDSKKDMSVMQTVLIALELLPETNSRLLLT